MRRAFLLTATTLLAATVASAGQTSAPAEQFARLAAEFDEIEATFMKELRADRTQEGVRAANDRNRKALQAWWQKSLDLVRQLPAEPAAVPVIEKYLSRNGVDNVELVGVLRKHHMADPRLARLVMSLYQSHDAPSWKFALEIADTHQDRATRGRASYSLGWIAKWQLIQTEVYERSGVRVPADKQPLLRAHIETYLGRAAKEYADVTSEGGHGTVGALAAAALAGMANLANLKVGKPTPEIEGADLDGARLKLSNYRGKVVLVVFWASWCGPCMADVPHEREIVEKLRGRPFALLGVNGDEDVAKAKEAVETAKITWRSFSPDDSGRRGGIPSAWNVFSWPTTYVIDHTGVIRHINLRGTDLDKPLEELVAQAEEAKKAKGR
jgi:thiol-disulfide isomerase/thioredoxin